MPHDDKPAGIDPIAQDIIRRKAQTLRRRGGFSTSDLPDLEQDLSLHLLQRTSAFNPRRGDWSAFVTAVVTAWGANLPRTRYAVKRDYRRVVPLLTTTESSEASNCPHEGRPNEQEQLELQLDVQQALGRLPDDLRPIAERLQHLSIAELARELRLPRTTLYQQIRRIRRRFQKMGLGKNG